MTQNVMEIVGSEIFWKGIADKRIALGADESDASSGLGKFRLCRGFLCGSRLDLDFLCGNCFSLDLLCGSFCLVFLNNRSKTFFDLLDYGIHCCQLLLCCRGFSLLSSCLLRSLLCRSFLRICLSGCLFPDSLFFLL